MTATTRAHDPGRRERLRLAARYVWWQRPADTIKTPALLLQQILRFGTEDDYLLARRYWGAAAVKRALVQAPPGALDERSWGFWHRHFRIKPKPVPRRRFA